MPATGKLKWFRQLVHHDLWDWDLPAAPTLIDVVRDGRKIPAVAVITKMSTVFIFDRVTGAPIFGVEEMPVPQSDVPGEATSPTQPFPVKPPPLSRTSFDPATDFYSLTPEHAAYCKDLWDQAPDVHEGHLHADQSLDRTMVMFPSTLGGGNWSGLSYDPARGLGLREHHESWTGRADGATDRCQARGGALQAHVTVELGLRAVLESRHADAMFGAAVRRARSRLTSTRARSSGGCRSACSTI